MGSYVRPEDQEPTLFLVRLKNHPKANEGDRFGDLQFNTTYRVYKVNDTDPKQHWWYIYSPDHKRSGGWSPKRFVKIVKEGIGDAVNL